MLLSEESWVMFFSTHCCSQQPQYKQQAKHWPNVHAWNSPVKCCPFKRIIPKVMTYRFYENVYIGWYCKNLTGIWEVRSLLSIFKIPKVLWKSICPPPYFLYFCLFVTYKFLRSSSLLLHKINVSKHKIHGFNWSFHLLQIKVYS